MDREDDERQGRGERAREAASELLDACDPQEVLPLLEGLRRLDPDESDGRLRIEFTHVIWDLPSRDLEKSAEIIRYGIHSGVEGYQSAAVLGLGTLAEVDFHRAIDLYEEASRR